VKAVKEAEAGAENIVAEARLKAADLQKQAESDAEAIRSRAAKAAKEAYEARMTEARSIGEKKLAEADSETRKQVEALKAAAAEREGSAVDKVIQTLL
jgi:vacuolar-type H+-ATPase subunit H